jgi:hypothetical protein
MSDDNPIGTALWLVAGGAAGLAAGRWIVPFFAPRSAPSSTTSPTSIAIAAMTRPRPGARSLGGGPSGSAVPIDPYATFAPVDVAASVRGPSGEMQPIDPYAPLITVPVLTTVPATPAPPTVTVTAPSRPVATPMTVAPNASIPITMPSQLEIGASPNTAPTRTEPKSVASPPVNTPTKLTPKPYATASRVRRFDPLFSRYRGTLPIEYVRALVERESNGQPNARAGSAIGLMQVVPVVLTDYNKRHGTSYRAEHLTDPAINVAIGCELLRLIVQSYRKHHPRTLRTDWDNPRFVELLTFGYNAGFSEAGGVGRVARYLEGLGATDITIDQVSAHAKLAGASKHLSNPAKVAWCKSVVALYQRERSLALPFISA